MLGYNYRMTDIQAAVGREQLKRLPEILERRRYLAQRYYHQLADIPGLKLPTEPTWAKSNWQSYCIRLSPQYDQRQLMQAMLDAGIGTRRGIMCAHREPAYQIEPWSCGVAEEKNMREIGSCDSYGALRYQLRESELAQDQSILLPLFHQMTEQEQDAVVNELKAACQMQI
jgi:dTDP-4-amino-4,6-dideoxygalactose transaminase